METNQTYYQNEIIVNLNLQPTEHVQSADTEDSCTQETAPAIEAFLDYAPSPLYENRENLQKKTKPPRPDQPETYAPTGKKTKDRPPVPERPSSISMQHKKVNKETVLMDQTMAMATMLRLPVERMQTVRLLFLRQRLSLQTVR